MRSRKNSGAAGPSQLAFITGRGFGAESYGTLVKAYARVDGEIRFCQAGDVDIVIAPEFMRVLAEERHQFYGYLQPSARENVKIEFLRLESRSASPDTGCHHQPP